MREKVQFWVEAVEKFAEAAAVYPQAVYCAFTKSLSMEWAYLQRVVGGCVELYAPLHAGSYSKQPYASALWW